MVSLRNFHKISDEMKIVILNIRSAYIHMAFLLSFMVVISLSLYSLPPATKLGQGYIFTGVCDSVNRGVCLSACWDTPRSRHPPGADTPREQTPPLPQSMLRDTVNARAVRILLECNLVNVCS